MALPDFIIIGAMKCGTSTLQAQLVGRPGIYMTEPKEPNFFSDDAIYARGLGWYEGLFDGAASGDIKGEASTHYTKLPTYPEAVSRLASALNSARLIYLIRDPVARAVSHYVHEWSMGKMDGDIDSAFDAHPELIDYGLYGAQIAPWVERFGKENVLVSSLEKMTRDPEGLLTSVGEFIGHPDPLPWKPELNRMNASADRIRRVPLHSLLIDSALATTLRRRIIPKSIRDKVRRGRQLTDRPTPSQALVTRLHEEFSEDRVRLTALFPENKDIADAYSDFAALPT